MESGVVGINTINKDTENDTPLQSQVRVPRDQVSSHVSISRYATRALP